MWTKKTNGNGTYYYAPADVLSRRLINLDFIREILPKVFASQYAITKLYNINLDD